MYVQGADAAKALTPELKAALTQILVDSDFGPTSVRPNVLSDGDRELISLVKRWDPSTAANFLLCQLKSKAFSTHANAGMMYKISELIGDERSAQLTRQYTDIAAKDNDVSAAIKASTEKLRSSVLGNFIRTVEDKLTKLDAQQSAN